MTTNYFDTQTKIYNTVAAYSSAVDWGIEFPLIIDRAEQRLYRDLDLLFTRVTDQSLTLASQVRQFALPTGLGYFLIIEGVNIITPSSATYATGTRSPVTPVSRPFIDAAYPNQTVANGVPEFFARPDDKNIIFGPAPDQPYPVEFIGTMRPLVLSSANSSSILTQMLPDLWHAACMCEASAYMRYTEVADQAGLATTWEGTYKELSKSALSEELRKKFHSAGWTSQNPSALAGPQK